MSGLDVYLRMICYGYEIHEGICMGDMIKTIVAKVYLWLFTFFRDIPRRDNDLDRMIARPMHGCGK
jgi:hypothetical protein